MSIFKKKQYIGEITTRLLENDSSSGSPTNYNARLVSPINFDSNFNNSQNVEYELINKWRSMVKNPYISFAINDIVNEMNTFFDDTYKYQVKIDLSECEYSKFLKKKIEEEWVYLLEILDIQNKFYNLLKDWYIDGKVYLKLDLEEGRGVTGINQLDPMFLKKDIDIESGKEYYIYNQVEDKKSNVYNNSSMNVEVNVGIPESNVISCNSGIMDDNHEVYLSFLDTAYVPLNQLTSIEDSLLVYRIARAPARRVFYIDTGMLPKSKAEAYMREVARNYKQEINYDPSTGKFSEQNVHLSLLDDLFLPRSGDSQRTEVSQLEGNSSFAESLKDLDYFRKKLFRSLLIPFNRWGGQEDGNEAKTYVSTAEITRDELKYSKFVKSLRSSFSNIFYDLLEKHLTVKHLTNKDTFEEYKSGIRFLWAEDSKYQERGALEVLGLRLDVLDRVNEYIEPGYFSVAWAKKNILRMTEAEIKEIEVDNKNSSEDVGGVEGSEGGFGDEGGGEGGFGDIESMSAEPPVDSGSENEAVDIGKKPIEVDDGNISKVDVKNVEVNNADIMNNVSSYLDALEQEKDLDQENYNNISRVQHNKLIQAD